MRPPRPRTSRLCHSSSVLAVAVAIVAESYRHETDPRHLILPLSQPTKCGNAIPKKSGFFSADSVKACKTDDNGFRLRLG